MSVMLPDRRPEGRESRLRLWVAVLLMAVLSVTSVIICKQFLSFNGGSAVIWFADAVAIAFLYRHRLRDWPLFVGTFFCVNVTTGLTMGFEGSVASIYTLAGLAEVLPAALMLRRFFPAGGYFDSLERWATFILISAVLPPLASASIGSAIASLRTGMEYSAIFPAWYLADAAGILVLLPLALNFSLASLRGLLDRALLGRLLVVAAVAIVAVFLILEVALLHFVFVALPLIWVATRLPLFQTLAVIFSVVLLLTMTYVGIDTHANPHITPAAGQQTGSLLVLAIFGSAIPAYVMAVYTNIERIRNARIVEVESSFRAAVEKSRIGMLLVGLDGTILRANRSFCEFLGYDEQELVGRNVVDITHTDDRAYTRAFCEELFGAEREAPQMEKRYVRKDGEVVWGYLSCCLARGVEGEPLYAVSQVEDIDWRKRSESSLREAKERLQVTLSSIADAVISTDINQCVNFMNPIAEQMTGVTLQQAENQPISAIFRVTQGREGELLGNPVAECLQLGEAVRGTEGAVLQSRDGRTYDIKHSASPLKTERGDLLGAVMVFQDVSESRKLIRQLSYKASHDDLTGLPNRDAFKRELLDAIENARDSDTSHALAYIDLDRFKVINDSAGHLAGDALLKKVSKYLRALLRNSDSVARLGGDEFGLLFRNCSKEQAKLRCEQLIRQIVTLRFPWNERVYDVGASIGITEINRRNDRLGDLLSQADVACYSAKHASRGTVMIYEMEQSAAAEQHREIIMASAVREALDEGQLRLCAQPIACGGDISAINHYEILVRMVDAGGKLILPAAFIPAAERYGLMLQVDRWVVDEVLVRRAAQVDAARINFALNLSADALGDSEFQAHVIRVLEQTPIPLSRISFEITETAMVNQMENASHFVATLRRMGCKVALDDFGNGLSSFNYLKAFSIDFIKIDGSFVRQVESNFVDLIIVESIHQVAHRLGAKTIAEYVEDAATAARLRTIGVDLIQGHHVGRPLLLEQLLTGAKKSEVLELAAVID
ncbi:PAS domain S-box-containing protein/diguanylate cyclase (GGDEF) domain-containing protein [Microbulbifer donghaiensis]|uniref:PAS domain S-box-containing protein/diguanylate cyclase (GGDEF) domain-containing protein n=1 Tax=Microbulbifer donghaiensis TaxID=494016 RepID=A0A1M5CDT3_9GAMM|nr:EAL domain-containing protein [Microbulbifer donghaiensis]SHF52826.1 PAS domain S-box-containing protein/diguanylate cyclase (GGDEF) domain-containing protein [Microbulbifer donghaiensis]